MSYATALRDKHDAEMHAEYLAEVRHLRARIAHWQRQVAKFGGDIQRETLARFEARYLAVTGETYTGGAL